MQSEEAHALLVLCKASDRDCLVLEGLLAGAAHGALPVAREVLRNTNAGCRRQPNFMICESLPLHSATKLHVMGGARHNQLQRLVAACGFTIDRGTGVLRPLPGRLQACGNRHVTPVFRKRPSD